MSAIFGIYHKDGSPLGEGSLDHLANAMVRWGPDGGGAWSGPEIGLGHLMLHTTPESLHERLPAVHDCIPNLVITADARLDNRRELFDALNISQSLRADLPDSLLILLAYEKWRDHCPERLLGDFAFAVWDGPNRILFCARDPMGCKPFFYWETPRRFLFASDIRAVLAHPQVPARLNEPLLAAALQQMTQHPEKRLTFYRDIVKLPPAHCLTVTATRADLRCYWSLDNMVEIRLPSDDAYAEQLRELLHRAVECRLRSVFPVGAHLSGGLDSSTLTAIAASSLRRSGRSLTAFSWSPPPQGNAPPDDERTDVEAVCRREGIPCHYTSLSLEDVARVYTSDFTRQPTEMMFREQHVQRRAAREGIRVMLSGWGGDEGISHRDHGYWPELLLTRQWRQLYREMDLVARTGGVCLAHRLWRYGVIFQRQILLPMIPDRLYRLKDPYGVNEPSPLSCIHPAFARRHLEEVATLRGPCLRDRPGVHAMQLHRLNYGHLTKRMEAWSISGAEHRLEYRYPLLDRRILEFALAVPSRMFYHNGQRRILFRHAAEGILPRHLQWKPGKFEAATFGVTRKLFPGAIKLAIARVRSLNGNRVVSSYIDVDRLTGILLDIQEPQAGWGVLEHAVWCFSIGQSNTA